MVALGQKCVTPTYAQGIPSSYVRRQYWNIFACRVPLRDGTAKWG